MEILLWLVPAALATCVAMGWAALAGRTEPENRRPAPGDPAYEKFAEAMRRPHPGAQLPKPPVRADPRSGVAVRPSRRVLFDVSDNAEESAEPQDRAAGAA